jgi:hypothetical protein
VVLHREEPVGLHTPVGVYRYVTLSSPIALNTTDDYSSPRRS